MNPSALSLKPPKSLLEKKQNTTHDCIIVPLPEPFTIIPQQKYTSGNWSLWNRIFYTFMYSIYTVNSFFLGGGGEREGGLSEVEKADKILRRQRRGAAFGVVGRAWMVCVLRGRKTKHTRADKNSDVFAVFISEVSAPTLWSSGKTNTLTFQKRMWQCVQRCSVSPYCSRWG